MNLKLVASRKSTASWNWHFGSSCSNPEWPEGNDKASWSRKNRGCELHAGKPAFLACLTTARRSSFGSGSSSSSFPFAFFSFLLFPFLAFFPFFAFLLFFFFLAFVPFPGAFFFFWGVSSFQVWKGLGACVYFEIHMGIHGDMNMGK